MSISTSGSSWRSFNRVNLTQMKNPSAKTGAAIGTSQASALLRATLVYPNQTPAAR
ncbi:hypothetical protein [Methylocystis sp.]|uniref:hypothetical protein n=1 Tax=Methylocystis sp. TaxID=1911079 RepID=UPI0027371033|nr:hypothetical protein [Methylocystis sp.]MDP3552635.1 hypothetical protein [Methylocystis sp.]